MKHILAGISFFVMIALSTFSVNAAMLGDSMVSPPVEVTAELMVSVLYSEPVVDNDQGADAIFKNSDTEMIVTGYSGRTYLVSAESVDNYFWYAADIPVIQLE